MKKIFLSLMLSLFGVIVFAQNITVKGLVTDAETGEPVPSAAVMVKGSNIGTVSDVDGKYSVSVPKNGVLVFSSIGYVTTEVAVEGQAVKNVSIKPDFQMLDETVVVAYGSQSAKTVTASISTIKEEAFKDLPNVSFDAMLQGQAAGVQVASANAGSGQAAKILIRGVSSISGGTDPLYIIDGLPINSSAVLSEYTDMSPLADINPNDILSIEVLKDAAATALYGSRAANGVVIITTKKGNKGDIKVTYDGNVGFQEPTKLFDMMDADQYVAFKNMAVKNAYGYNECDVNGGSNFSDRGRYAFNKMEDANGNPISTNWNKMIFKNGFIHNHTVAIQGGTDKTTYYASANYASQDGIVFGDSYKRVGVKSSVSSQITKWLQVGINAQYSHGATTSKDASRVDGVFSAAGLPRQAMILPPVLPAYNEDGSYYTTSDGQYIGTGKIRISTLGYPNPMGSKENFNNQNSDRIIASGFVAITPVEGLTLRSQYGADFMRADEETFWDPLYGQGTNYPGYAWRSYSNNLDWTWTNTINYNLHLGDNSFDFLVGMEAFESKYEYDGINGSVILNDLYDGFKAGYSEYSAGGACGDKSLVSYFGRINYDYKSKYMVSANFRRDGLSSLGAQKKWGNFWGVSGAWRISEEDFFEPVRNVIDDLKLKASYGVVGNSDIGYYPAQSYYGDALYGGSAALALSNIGDEALAWEQSNKFDVGLVIDFINRINVGVDYYNTDSKNLVLAVPQGPSTGIGSLITNAGSLRNRGVEVTIAADVFRRRNFIWSTNFNFTTAKNTVLELAEGVDAIYGGDEDDPASITTPGYSIGQLYIFPTGGIDSETGRRVFYGSNGERTTYDHMTRCWYLEDGTEFAGALSRVRCGNTLPTWFGGWSNTFKFYGVDINLMFQFSGGNWIYNGNTATGSDMRWWNNFKEVADKCWSPSNKDAKYAYPIYGDNVSNGSAYEISDWIERGDYLRLKNISVGYTFDFSKYGIKQKVGISNIRLYGQIQNAFVLTAYTGLDPEVTSSYTTQQILAGGYDKNTMPHARTYTLGLQVAF